MDIIGLQRSTAGKPLLFPVWIFSIVGAADLLLAMVLGPALIRDPGDFGLAYIIPTVYVPLLLVTHFYALKILGQRSGEKKRSYSPGVSGAELYAPAGDPARAPLA